MAEMQTQDNRRKRGGIRSQKLSTRVDLTPMVDLGFLLITFFIFTTTMSKANGMSLVVPDDKPTPNGSVVPESKTLSLILEGDDKILYYHGKDAAHKKETDYSVQGLRKLILDKMQEVQLKSGKRNETIILIKPTMQSSYKNIIAVLDEMRINDVKKYVLMDITPEEE